MNIGKGRTEVGHQQIPFFDYSAVFAPYEAEILPLITDVLRRGAFILQAELRLFEANLAAFVGAQHVIGVANGTDALILALHAARIGPRDEVILPSHTYVATAAAVHFVGATPVLVDCGPDHLIDPDAVSSAITTRTRALLPVQLNGRVCDMEAIERIALEHDLAVLEDAAQGVGAWLGGRHAGTLGLAGTFSFYPAKTLGCCGDGGAIVTDDDSFAERVRLLRDHGRNEEGEVVSWGLNSRLDNLQAAILNVRLRHLPEEIKRRREIATYYEEHLSDIPEIALPPAPGSDYSRIDAFQNYEIEAERRDELKEYLASHGVGVIVQWGGRAVHQMKALRFGAHLPKTDALFDRCLLLPMRPTLSEAELAVVCDLIRAYYAQL